MSNRTTFDASDLFAIRDCVLQHISTCKASWGSVDGDDWWQRIIRVAHKTDLMLEERGRARRKKLEAELKDMGL